MNFFTFTKSGRTLLLAGVATVSAVCWLGCGDGGNPGGGGGGGTLSCGNRECRSAEMPDGKTWMTENLNKTTKDSWCYDNSADSCAKYGRLYTWDAAKKACPTGWHLPTRDEWDNLAEFVGGTRKDYTIGDNIYQYDWLDAGTKLKSTSGWDHNGNGTDDFGFSALPGGFTTQSVHLWAGVSGYWWTATRDMESDFDNNIFAYRTNMLSTNIVNVTSARCGMGYSVRCVKN